MRIIPITDFGKFSFKRAAFTLDERLFSQAMRKRVIKTKRSRNGKFISRESEIVPFTVVYDKRQTVDSSSEFFRLKNKQ